MKIKYLHLSLLVLLAAPVVSAEEDPIAKIGWKKIEELKTPEIVKPKTGSQKPINLFELKDPKITERNHAIGGEIRYSGVAGTGFVEMWTHYRDRGPYFSRTLGEYGPMAKVTGDSEWRPFLLPFFSDGKGLPNRLSVNLVLPGGGEVEFRNLGLYQLPGDRLSKAIAGGGNAWWGNSFAAKLGALGGTLAGFWGMMCGILCWLGKGRHFVTISMLMAIVIGTFGFIACVIAAFTHQPYGVWYPLLLMGGILLTLGAIGYPCARKIYLNHELRAISAAG